MDDSEVKDGLRHGYFKEVIHQMIIIENLQNELFKVIWNEGWKLLLKRSNGIDDVLFGIVGLF